MVHVFFDTEFTSLLDPQLLSVGLVTMDGREYYAELDMQGEVGKERLAATGWDVRENIIEDKFGLFPESVCDSDWAVGRRVGEWLLQVAESAPAGRIRLCYDYSADLELLVGALEECSLWPRVRIVATEGNIARETGSVGPELASEAAFRALRRRTPPLYRHHALADALALRAAWRTWRLVHERALDFKRLLQVVGERQEVWLYEWLATPALALNNQTALDLVDHPDGLQIVLDALLRIEGGCG